MFLLLLGFLLYLIYKLNFPTTVHMYRKKACMWFSPLPFQTSIWEEVLDASPMNRRTI